VSKIANYNPYLPQILGNEWVPIRNEDLVLDPFANSLERGYGFTLPSSTQVNNVRFYINEFPPLFVRNQAYTANIYPRGQEAESGPIRSVIIPCNAGTITGTGAVTSPSTSTIPEVVYNPSGNYFINWQIGGAAGATRASFFFATNSYSQLLSGKRILGVNLLTGINVTDSADFDPDDFASTAGDLTPYLVNDTFNADFPALPNGFVIYRPLVTSFTPTDTRLLVRTRMGDADLAYGTTGGLTSATPNISQWTYSELQRFEVSSSNRLFALLASGAIANSAEGASVLILYMALEVFYCEERRVAFGSRNINGLRIVQARDPFQLGMNQIIVRDTSGNTNPILGPGDYTVTLSEANTGDDFNVAFSPFETAKVNELRQLYEIPSIPGIQVNLPFPLNEEAIDTTFTKESTALIPQLSMHTSGGVVINTSHSYGRQSIGQVWGTNFVAQDIDDSAIPAGTSYPGVRFIARRFGDTTVPLKLTGIYPSGVASSTASITPAEFDVLDEILDGWKEVRLRFSTPPTMGGALYPSWKFTATGETAGNRWEVLGAAAPAASGIAQQMPISLQFGEVPSAQQLYASTYGSTNSTVFTSSFIAAGAAAHGNNASVVPTMPAGIAAAKAAGDSVLLLVWAAIRNSGTGTVDVPAGYTQLLATGNAALLGKTWDGVEGAPTITFSNGVANATTSAQMAAWTNISLDVLSSASQLNGSAQNIAYPALSANNDCLMIWMGWKQDDWTSVATLGGLTAIGDPSSTLGDDQGIVWQFVLFTGSNSVSSGSFVVTGGAAAISRGALIALRQINDAGERVMETWMPQGLASPYVTSPTDDPASDAVIMFAQDMPTVTGFTVATASQAVSGIGLDCGIAPCGVPTYILYNQLSWGLPVNTGLASDDFTRTVVNGFGSATSGGAYTLSATAAEYAVNGTQGAITPAAGNVMTLATLANVGVDADITVTISNSGAITSGTSARGAAVARFTNINNYYCALVQTTSAGANLISFQKTVAGVETVLLTSNLSLGINNSSELKLRFLIKGTILKAKAWSVYGTEPDGWQIETTDTSLTTGSGIGVAARSGTATGNTILFDNLTVGPPSFWFKHYEMQRSDDLTEWQTIMECTSIGVTGFRDYEARTDMSSSYRIRNVDVYDFAGPWSSTVTTTIPTPGVSGSCLTGAHVMIFTTNERQDGSSNLAYSNAWESDVEEGFAFAEAGFTQLQPMYNRDFFTAFRPTERGGDQFSRDILVQAAAISPETLPGFRALSDMAWDDVSYICLRDEEGNRWFVNVNVPSGVVKNRRRLYLATVQIVEVTDTPSPVDP
jgi:hypothetical protein